LTYAKASTACDFLLDTKQCRERNFLNNIQAILQDQLKNRPVCRPRSPLIPLPF
jgi:hypothetical protein